MARIITHLIFPCGYEVYVDFRALTRIGYSFNDDKGCPLHGKNCTQSKSKAKVKK